jgi:hypothetical protein
MVSTKAVADPKDKYLTDKVSVIVTCPACRLKEYWYLIIQG